MFHHSHKLSRLFLTLWAMAAFISAVVHLAAPLLMSAGTSWPFAYGWQREIAFFDIVLALYVGVQLRSASEAEQVKLVYFFAVLSLCLGLNHLLSALGSGWGYIHLAASIGNALAVVVALLIFVKRRGHQGA